MPTFAFSAYRVKGKRHAVLTFDQFLSGRGPKLCVSLLSIPPDRSWHTLANVALAASNFRRQAQVEALDTVSSSAKRAATSNGSSSSTLTVPNPRHYRPPSTVLAWWEDDLGLWFVLEASHLSYTPFTDVWHDIVGAGWPEQCSPDEKGLAVEKNWAAACDLLLRAVQCLQALHDRQMSLNWCHPDCFGVTGGQVVINRLWGATALPGLSLPPLITPALAASALFTREALHHSTCNLSEAYIFRHLRYLAPEAAISRRVSPSNDIYSWGVLAYELVTGTTIDGGPDSPDLRKSTSSPISTNTLPIAYALRWRR